MKIAIIPYIQIVTAAQVSFEFSKIYGESPSAVNNIFHDMEKSVAVDLYNLGIFYSISLEIGQPSQKIIVLLDTGSSDLWLVGAENPFCIGSSSSLGSATMFDAENQPTIDCSTYGVYNSSISKNGSSNGTSFNITYDDGIYASGLWMQDSFTLDQKVYHGLNFGNANYTNSAVGIMGIGLPKLESTEYGVSPYGYTNFPQMLVQNGLIQRNVYSMYMNDVDAKTGEIIFGGVDTAKFTGNLYTLPMVRTKPGQSSPENFAITLQGLGLVYGNGSDATFSCNKTIVLLDSGSELTYLPAWITNNIVNKLDAKYDSDIGFYTFDCPKFKSSETFVFDFGGFQLNVPLINFSQNISNGTTCALSILETQDERDPGILGDGFLAAAYIVFDVDNLEISLGQAVFNKQKSFQEITSTIPSATRAPGYSSTVAAVTGKDETADIFTLPNTVFSSQSTSTTKHQSKKQKSSLTFTECGITDSGTTTNTICSIPGNTSLTTLSLRSGGTFIKLHMVTIFWAFLLVVSL